MTVLAGKPLQDFGDVTRALLDLEALADETGSLRPALAHAGLDPDVVESCAHGVTDSLSRHRTAINHPHLLVLGICVGLRLREASA